MSLELRNFLDMMRRRAELARAVADADLALADADGQPPWWAGPSAARLPAPELERQTARAKADAARAAHDELAEEIMRAIPTVSATHPQVEIVHRIAEATRAVLSAQEPHRGLEKDLVGIADFLLEQWVPDLEPDRIFATLTDDAKRAAAVVSGQATWKQDPQRVWAPITESELAGRAAASLSTAELEKARAELARESIEYEAAALAQRDALRRLKEARGKGVPELDAHAERLAGDVARECHELTAASERVRQLALEALAVFPPMRVFAAALAAASAIDANPGVVEYAIHNGGIVGPRRSSWARVMLLRALEELQDAADAAFDGLWSAFMGREKHRSDGHPYREQPTAVAAQDPASPDQEARLFATLDRAKVIDYVRKGLTHAQMLGVVSRTRRASKEKVALLDRIRFWSEAPAEASTAELGARERWHLDALRTYGHQVFSIVSSAAASFPILALRNTLMMASINVDRISATGAFGGCSVYGREQATASVQQLAVAVEAFTGWGGTKWDFMLSVARGGHGSYPVQRAVAEDLGPGFPLLIARMQQSGEAMTHARQAAGQAEVSLWDQLVGGESARARDQWSAQARAAFQDLEHCFSDANARLMHALQRWPVFPLYFDLGDIIASVGQVTAQYNAFNKRCAVVGREQVQFLLRRWMGLALVHLGRMPSDGELLERYAAQRLR